MEQFKNMDIDKMKKSRDELQALFQSFMLAGQSAMKMKRNMSSFNN